MAIIAFARTVRLGFSGVFTNIERPTGVNHGVLSFRRSFRICLQARTI